MNTVDSRIVELKFDGQQFQNGVSSTLGSLEKLKEALKFDRDSGGLDKLNKQASQVNLNPIVEAAGRATLSFSAMGAAGVTAIMNITNRVVDSAIAMGKSIAITPISSGLKEYELNLNSIQTILANTQKDGTKLSDVNKALDELNEYSDKTIYNFSQMAENIGRFTAAGVDLKTSTADIKGIANLAALSGTNSERAAGAMEQLSQAIAAGTVLAQDWNSVTNAGMGGAVFQDAIMETARVHGVAVDEMIKKKGSFKASLEEGWLTGDIMSETLLKFTGDLTDAQLKSMGYTEKQVQAIQKQAKSAMGAATELKTFTSTLDFLQQTSGSGWADTWELIFGDFGEAKTLWTNVGNALGGIIQRSADARNAVLEDWKKLGGRDDLIAGFKNIFKSLEAVFKTVGDAFRTVFPPTTGQDLKDMTSGFRKFTEMLIPSKDTLLVIKNVLIGVFKVFRFVGTAIGFVFGLIKNAFTALVSLDLGPLGDSFKSISDALTKSGPKLRGFLESLDEKLSSVGDGLKGFIDKIKNAMKTLKDSVLKPIQDLFGGGAGGGGMDIGKILFGSFLAVDFGAIVLVIVKGLRKLFAFQDSMRSVVTSFSDALQGVTGVLGAMQTNLKASALVKIAIAIGILAAALYFLTSVDPDNLKYAGVAIGIVAAALVIAMKQLAAVTSGTSIATALKLPFMAAGLVLVALAMLAISAAIKKIADVPMKNITKALVTFGLVLIGFTAIAGPLSKNAGGMILAGLAIYTMAFAMKRLAKALVIIGGLDLKKMALGLAAVLTTIITMSYALKLMPDIRWQGVGMLLVALGLKALSAAITEYANTDWSKIGKGLLLIAATMVVLSLALRVMPKNMAAIAIGLLILGGALLVVVQAITLMSQVPIGAALKGIILLGGALVLLSLGLRAMNGTLIGSFALLIAAGALLVAAHAIEMLSGLSIGQVLIALAGLAGVLLIFGLAGALMGPVIPVLLALGGVIALIGLGALMAGVGIVAMAAGLTILVGLGTAASAAMYAFLIAIAAALPIVAIGIANAIIAFSLTIAKGAPAIKSALSALITAFLEALTENIPKLADLFRKVLDATLAIIVEFTPKIAAAGLQLLTSLLRILRDHLDPLIDLAGEIIAKFILGIGRNSNRIVNAAVDVLIMFIEGIGRNVTRVYNSGMKTLIKFLNGIADGIEKNTEAITKAGWRIAKGLVKGVMKGIAAGVKDVVGAVKDLGRKALDALTGIWDSHSPSKEFEKIGSYAVQGVSLGLKSSPGLVTDAAESVGTTAMSTLKESMKNASSLIMDEIDTRPVIAPVLDLSDIKKNSSQIKSYVPDMNAKPGALSYNAARAISIEQEKTLKAKQIDTPAPSKMEFVQNNYSPKPLTALEIYQNTRNQLSLAKEFLSA